MKKAKEYIAFIVVPWAVLAGLYYFKRDEFDGPALFICTLLLIVFTIIIIKYMNRPLKIQVELEPNRVLPYWDDVQVLVRQLTWLDNIDDAKEAIRKAIDQLEPTWGDQPASDKYTITQINPSTFKVSYKNGSRLITLAKVSKWMPSIEQ